MVALEVLRFKHCTDIHIAVLIKAAYGHDLIEDTRVTYNDVLKQTTIEVANIIYALTNEKGRNRKERADNLYYVGIVNTPGAVFVKLCDRIANVRFGILTNSPMVEMYKKENTDFLFQILTLKNRELLQPMIDCLCQLLEEYKPINVL